MDGIMGRQTIPSLAILKVNLDTLRKDYLECFVPFVAQCIISLKPDVVSASDLQTKMLQDFGLQVPQNAFKPILKRTEKRGYIRRQYKTYVPNYEALNRLDFESTRQRVLRDHTALLTKLEEFALTKHSVRLSQDRAEALLLSYVTQYDVELLTYSVAGSPIDTTQTMPTKDYYLLNAFVRHLHTADPEGFDYLDKIVKGHMLSNALIFPHFVNVQKRFHRVSVYCDTALMLRALGYEGSAAKAPCKELLDLLYQLGAHPGCFRHTRDEVRNVLYACMRDLGSTKPDVRFGPTFRYLTEAGYTQTDIELDLNKLDKKIEQLGITVSDTPEYSERLQIDEEGLTNALQEAVRYAPEKERARTHDVTCLSAVYRLRKGRACEYLEDCAALFVTANAPLAASAQRFFTSESYSPQGTVPPAITDYLLTTILWLKRPMSVPDLPLKYIVAQSYAAMEPGEHLWRKYLTEISSLRQKGDITQDDYYFLRALPQARTELMNHTMGDENALVEGTPQEILERVKQNIRAEQSAGMQQYLSRIESIERELESERAKTRQKEDSLNAKISRRSRKIAHLASRVLVGAVMALLIFGVCTSLPTIPPPLRLHWLSNLRLIVFAILAVFYIFELFFGIRFKDYLNRFEVSLANRIEQKLKAWFIP